MTVVGMPTGMQSFEEVVKDGKEQIARSTERYRVFGATSSTEKTTFGGAPALKGTLTLPGRFKYTSVEFLRGNRYYMLTYAGPPDPYGKYQDVATLSMKTFDPLAKKVTEEDRIAAYVATKKRVAELSIEEGHIDIALRAIDEGLAADPDNEELNRLKKNIVENMKKQ